MKDLAKIQGLRTIEEISQILGITRQSAINLVSKLKKEGYATKTGGRQQKRIYKITIYQQTKSNGMFDIINKYSKIKVIPLFKHVINGEYSAENALIDAVLLRNRRVLLASLFLFNHIKDWKKLSQLAKKHNIESKIGCLYDLARTAVKTRRIPENIYKKLKTKKTKHAVNLADNSEILNKEWNCLIPFSKEDLKELK
jgi:DNA-binding Lrp family transcriptional regulator